MLRKEDRSFTISTGAAQCSQCAAEWEIVVLAWRGFTNIRLAERENSGDARQSAAAQTGNIISVAMLLNSLQQCMLLRAVPAALPGSPASCRLIGVIGKQG